MKPLLRHFGGLLGWPRLSSPKVGVFIPCVAEHVHYLPQVIRKLNQGYVRPHRIAVVVSNLFGRTFSLPSNIIFRKFDHLVETGIAKQMAYEMLDDCDVVCYQDADDLPSLNRVGYVQKLFTNSYVNVFNHSYRTTEWPIWGLENDRAEAFPGTSAWERSFLSGKLSEATGHNAFGAVLKFPVHAGAVSVRRDVLDVVRWRSFSDLPLFPEHLDKTKGDDWHFCFECLHRFKHTHWFSKAVLYRYRVH